MSFCEKIKGLKIEPLTVSLILTLILVSVQFILTLVWRIMRASAILRASTLGSEHSICQPCSALWIEGNLPSGCEEEKDSENSGRCCCNAGLVIDTLVKKSTKTLFGDYRPRATAVVIKANCSNDRQIMGKVSGIEYKRLTEETRERNLVYWVKSAKSYLDSVRYTNGRFYISIPGYYHVFSQIKYDHDPTAVNDTDATQSHSLYKYSFKQGRKEKLVESSRTFSELQSSVNNGTSFIGAVFKFEKDDEIMIKSTHTHKLIGDDTENFFSLYII